MMVKSGNIFMYFVGILIVLLTVFVVYVKWCLTYWEKRGIPYISPDFLFGNVKGLIMKRCTFAEAFANIYNNFKASGHKFVGCYFLTRPLLMVMDPQLIKNIITKDFDHFVDRGVYINERKDPLSGHLFNLPGTKWRNLRVKLTPTFTSGKMKMMFQTLVDCSGGLVKAVEELESSSIEIRDILARYTTDVIGSCAFGLDCNSLKDPETEFRIYGKKFFNPDQIGALKFFCFFSYPKILEILDTPVTDKDITEFYLNVVKNTIKYRQENNVQRKDFMNLLLQMKNRGKVENGINNENGKESEPAINLNDKEIAAQCFLFFLAGFETSSTALTYCLYELAKNCKIQETLREEIHETMTRYDGKITYESVSEMKYMDNVVNETLRKYPPLGILNRVCTKEYHLPEVNLHIPKGQAVFISIQGMQNDPKYYPEPEKFDPDRFTEEVKKTRPPYTFLPFGEGPRVCIGSRFAMMQVKVALVVLLMTFRFTLNEKTKEPLVLNCNAFITSVKDGIWLNAVKI